MKHTPGPWSTESDYSLVMGSQVVAGLIGPDDADRDTLRANARLISAAPDMLAALKLMLTSEMPRDPMLAKMQAGRNAIALEAINKAMGIK